MSWFGIRRVLLELETKLAGVDGPAIDYTAAQSRILEEVFPEEARRAGLL